MTQLSNQQQSISGVNLDEEYGNLQRFSSITWRMRRFCRRANAIFDALINIR
ncbi:flagellar hook-associated protein 1 [Escherichia coli]|uniref:Flagellar hook-associated protein 1 n=1 Tax=Escherichia coli TaxID=562 RepID=A0A377DE34_ECOLX|nr:flagellar hook-associated protein 1 [Escherichia coli]